MNSGLNSLIAQAKNLARKGDNLGAMEIAEQVVAQYPHHLEVRLLRSYLFELVSDFASALADISKAIDINAMEPHLYYNRGRYLFYQGNFSGSVADFEKGLELCEFHKNDYYCGELHFWCAESLLKLGRKRDAIAHLSNIPIDFSSWTDTLRTKRDLLDDCKI